MEKKYRVSVNNDYIIAEGELPVCLVAHLDTVSEKPPTDIYYDSERHVMWSPQLLGADDRAGVYAIIQIIEAGYRPHIIFTTDEEKGALGAQALVIQKPNCPLENLKAIFQLDRRGNEDCVFYDCSNPDFTKFVESFGFKTAQGSFSDISILGPAWGVAAANLSVGYYGEHAPTEILKTDELEITIAKVKNILSKVNEMPKYEYIESTIWKPFHFPSSNFENVCSFCGKPLSKKKNFLIEKEGFVFDICKNCYSRYYDEPNKNNCFDF